MPFFKSVQSKLAALALTSASVLVAAFYLFDAYGIFSHPPDYAAAETPGRTEVKIVQPTMMYGMVVDSLRIVEDMVKRNQRFVDLLEGHFVAPEVMKQLHLVPRHLFDFRKIVPNRKYTLITEQDSLQSAKALVYEPSPVDYVIFHLEDTLMVEVCRREVEVAEMSLSGIIESSLSQTIEVMGGTPELTNRMVDIFAWQIDFQRLQKGDKFKLIYEEHRVDGTPIGIGNILGAWFEHFGSSYYAIPFDQGDGPDFFDAEGGSLRKALLKYPIEFSRISSRYSRSRFHPVSKVFRAHLGTDFAAPTGTPIRSVGDGIVLEAQYKANNGNYVKIRHNATYTTQYLHMYKIASGVRPGARVKQGQTIGFVGSTGLATGPHLCYRFWRNGVQVDALRVKLPPSRPVQAEYDSLFQQKRQQVIRKLDTIAFPPGIETIAAGN